MRKLTTTIGAFAVSSLLATGCSQPEETSADTTISLGVASLPIFAPVFVADEKGYFEDRGLDVELEAVQVGQDAIPLLSSGQMDALAAGFAAGMFSGLEEGMEFRVVGSMGVADGTDFAPAHIVVRQELIDDGTVTGLEDLEGLDYGVAGGVGGGAAFLSALGLEEAGLTLNDVALENVSHADTLGALQSGSIDAGLLAAPFSEMAFAEGTAESMWFPPEGTSATGLMYGEHFVEDERATLLFDALAEAAEDLQGEARYDEEHLEIVGNALEMSAEDLEDIPLYTWYADLAPLTDQLTKMESVWMEAGALKYDSPLDTDDYIDSSFSEQVDN